MQIVVHTKIPDDSSLRHQWNGLLQRMERPQVSYTYEWAVAVSRAYAASLQPLLLTAYRQRTLAGVVALVKDATGKRLSFLTASTADYCDFISSLNDRAEFIERVVLELRRMGACEIRLANLPADSVSVNTLQAALRKARYSHFARSAYCCAQVPLVSDEDRMQTRTSTWSRLKRLSKIWAKHGRVTVSHQQNWDELSREFPDLATAHVERFLAAGRVSNLVRQERRAFLLELGKLLSAQGSLTLSTLKLDGRTIAWNYGFRFGGNWFWYQPAFDRDMAHLSPGTYLLCEILRQASEDPQIHTVDLGLGDEEYKERYSKAGRMTLHITASSGRRAWLNCNASEKKFQEMDSPVGSTSSRHVPCSSSPAQTKSCFSRAPPRSRSAPIYAYNPSHSSCLRPPLCSTRQKLEPWITSCALLNASIPAAQMDSRSQIWKAFPFIFVGCRNFKASR